MQIEALENQGKLPKLDRSVSIVGPDVNADGVCDDFDAQGVRLIWVENLPDAGEWDGVRDRLVRAAAI